MKAWHAAVIAAEETEFDPDQVTPGAAGFVLTAVFAIAVILLGFDLVRRLRRTKYRAEIREELAAELAEQPGDAAGEQSPGAQEESARQPRDADPDSGLDPESGSAPEARS